MIFNKKDLNHKEHLSRLSHVLVKMAAFQPAQKINQKISIRKRIIKYFDL
jgi:hypothetical protein